MKLKITFDTPNIVQDTLEKNDLSLGNDKLKDLINKFIYLGSSVTIELDTEKGTARVVPVNE